MSKHSDNLVEVKLNKQISSDMKLVLDKFKELIVESMEPETSRKDNLRSQAIVFAALKSLQLKRIVKARDIYQEHHVPQEWIRTPG